MVKKNPKNSNEDLFTIVIEVAESDPEEYRPIFKKISDSEYQIHYWKSKENAHRFIKEQNFQADKLKIVKYDDKIVLKTLKMYEDRFTVEKIIND